MTDYLILKYPLSLDVVNQTVLMPEGAIILLVAAPNDQLALWARVSPDAVKVARELVVIGTGVDLPPALEADPEQYHVGSVAMMGGQLVAHVFDLGEA